MIDGKLGISPQVGSITNLGKRAKSANFRELNYWWNMSASEAILSMAELGREGILVHKAGQIEAANQAVYRIFGVPADALVGKPLHRYLELPPLPDDYVSGTPLETIAITESGQAIYLEVIPIELGEKRWAMLLLDITQRQLAENHVAESEMMLSLIFNYTHDVMGLLELRDNAWYLVKINRNVERYREIFGEQLNEQDLIGLTLHQYLRECFHLSEEEIAAYFEHVNKALASGKPVQLEESTPYGKGNMIIEESIITPIADAHGPRYLLLVSKDITARRQAEQALEASNQRYKRLLGNLPGAVFQCRFDAHWTLRFISAGIETVTGYPAKAFLPPSNVVSYSGLIASFDIDRVRHEVETAIKAHKSYLVEYRITHRDGSERWVRERGNGVYNSSDQPTHIEGFIFDITNTIAAEQRVLSSILETETRERSRIAKELHDSLVQNLTSSSLTLGALRDIADQLPQAQLERYNRGMELLKNAILECREISHNLMPKSIEDFGLTVAINSTLEDLNSASDCTFEFIDNLENVRLDSRVALTLYRVVQEALNNILKHAQASRATVQLLRFGQTLQLIIEDNGQGFDAKASNGHSFGLDSIRSRARSLGAQVFIDSNPRSGTSIHLELDLWKA